MSNLVKLRGFAEKLQSDVKGFGSDPADVGSEAAHLVAEGGDAMANGLVNVEGDEEAHGSHHHAADEVERLLAGPAADALAVPGKATLHGFVSACRR